MMAEAKRCEKGKMVGRKASIESQQQDLVLANAKQELRVHRGITREKLRPMPCKREVLESTGLNCRCWKERRTWRPPAG